MGLARTMGSAPTTIGVACTLAAMAASGCSLVPLDELQDGAASGSGASSTTTSSSASSTGVGGAGGSTSTGGSGGEAVGCEPSAGMPGAALWGRVVGDAQVQEVMAVAADASCGVIVGGNLRGTADFGDGHVLESAGNADVFLVKLDSRGDFVWGQRFGDAADQFLEDLVVAADRVLVTGTFEGSADFGTGPQASAGGYDVFVAAFEAAGGDPIWAWTWGGADAERARGVAVLPTGEALVFGDYYGPVDACSGPLPADASPNTEDLFLAKLSVLGGCEWTRAFSGADSERAGDVAVDPAGDVLIAGDFRGAFQIGPSNLIAGDGIRDVFVAKLDADGKGIWGRGFGGGQLSENARHEARAIAAGSDGSIYVAGGFQALLQFDAVSVVSPATYDGFVAKLTGAGGGLWARQLFATSQEKPSIAGVAGGGVVYASGFDGTAMIGKRPFVSSGLDGLVARLDGDGSAVWATAITGAGDQRASATAVDATGAVLVGGGCVDAVDFGQGPVGCATGDLVVLKLAP